jgi:hypothetical protein
MQKRTINSRFLRLCMVLLGLFLIAGWSASRIDAAAPAVTQTEIVLDASGSMNGRLAGGPLKIAAAKEAVTALLNRIPQTELALRVFGSQSSKERKDCADTRLVVGFMPLAEARAKILAALPGIEARGFTPITMALTRAAEDFPRGIAGQREILLVSDGKETCNGDPCSLANALAEQADPIVIQTVGLGVDAAARSQLECIAWASGGRYFPARDAGQLAEAMAEAVAIPVGAPGKSTGKGWLKVDNAGLKGHRVLKADTGEQIGVVSTTQVTIALPAGIYNVEFGPQLWKSVVIRAGETTVLQPGVLVVEHASLAGEKIIDPETTLVQGTVNNLQNRIALIPGQYDVMFGPLLWPVDLQPGKETVLNPGTVTVHNAGVPGIKIRTREGEVVGEVSQTRDCLPLPPGDYEISLHGQPKAFSLDNGQALVFNEK